MIDFNARFKQRIKDSLDSEIVTTEDGYKVWWPSKVHGYFNASTLRYMADLLDEYNKEWDQIVASQL
jgi:hypothetical protein